MSRWSLAGKGVTCGYDGAVIPEGSLVWTRLRLRRCEQHAPRAYDPADLERPVVAPVRNLRQEVIPINPELREEFHEILRKGGGIKGRTRSAVKPFAEVAEDPAVARSGADH